jgi:hypothetical protein
MTQLIAMDKNFLRNLVKNVSKKILSETKSSIIII